MHLAREISALEVDVLGLQEVDRGKLRSGGVDQLGTIAKCTGLRPLFAPTRRNYGMGLLSRLPVVRASFLKLEGRRSPWIRGGRFGWRFKWPDQRACLYALLQSGQGPLAVGVAHLSTVRHIARRQLEIALGGFEKFAPDVPAVLMGDLNLRINHVEEAVDGTGFHILARGNSTPSWQPVIQIDHILGRGVRGYDACVVSMPISDHAAVVADIRYVGEWENG